MKLTGKQIRNLDEEKAKKICQLVKRNPIYFIIENVYDTYNTGSFFRLADALAVRKVYLTGRTETPPNIKIKRAAVGTDRIVSWKYEKTTKSAIADIRNNLSLNERKKFQVIGVEQDKKSIDYVQVKYSFPIALIVGNETSGIEKQTLDLVDQIVEIPMYGVNISLNVLVAAGVIGYWLAYQIKPSSD